MHGGLLFGGANVLDGFEFAAEENRLGDAAGETPNEGIKRSDPIELRGSETARGADDNARQSRRFSLVHAVKSSCETALGSDEVRTALQDLRGQSGGHASRQGGKGAARLKPAGGIMAGDDFDGADRLRSRLLRDDQCILGGRGAGSDLRHVEVA